jgi:hypothetical protein
MDLNLSTTVFELTALRTKLLHATYNAVFASEATERANATTEALAIQVCIEGHLQKAWEIAGRIAEFARSPANESRLATLDSFLNLCEQPSLKKGMQAGSIPCQQVYTAGRDLADLPVPTGRFNG